ncbi:putative exosome complex exonuclease rrp protein [Zalerion maritima]|uniref:Exosome complex exonuclease rrp protein n=1 Tax=Zalerion maritima TaxID=339359 RepID=A0AAD5WRS1_9PEZI|nr:putative exosome complex exonuclease rrp protein [Zalerion maritima]
MTSQDFKSTEDKIKSSLLALTRSINKVAKEDLSFQRRVHPEVASQLDDANERLVDLASGLLKSATKNTDLRTPRLDDVDDIDLRWRGIVDVVDSLLEKADTTLDEYTGLVKRQELQAINAADTTLRPAQKQNLRSGVLSYSLRHANISKPQLKFERKPDNYESPWRPILNVKPHAKVSLEDSLQLFTHEGKTTATRYAQRPPPWTQRYQKQQSIDANLGSRGQRAECKGNKQQERPAKQHDGPAPRSAGSSHHGPWQKQRVTNPKLRYRNPYEQEIHDVQFPNHVYAKQPPIHYLPSESTAATWVDTFEGVLEMLEELKKAKEIAVDLEHHDYRTYIGLTSLMQISTREQDWIVDTLKPWRHRLEVLNEVFADPKILKVFHGCFMDMIWLQRDLGLYVVNLFDTGAACEALEFPGRSLAYLLKRFVDFDADKKYQLADWRIRPIPEEMLYYARSDTHYLLYIYDHLRNALIDASDPEKPAENRVTWVMNKSKEYALQIYEGHDYGEDGKGPMGWYKQLYKINPPKYTDNQFAVYRAVHKWRDDLARADDEDPAYIMPHHAVFDISRHIPTDLRALISLLGHASHGAKPKIQELLSVVQQAASNPNPPSFKAAFYASGSASAGHPGSQPQAPQEEAVVAQIQRSTRSQLFGDVPLSSVWDDQSSKVTNNMQGVKIPVPWAKYVTGFTAEEALETPKIADLTMDAPASAPVLEQEPQVEAQQVFTLRTGRKRKSQALNEEVVSSEQVDTSSSDPDTDLDSEDDSEEDGENEKSKEEDVKMTGSSAAEEYFELTDPEGEASSSKKTKKKKKKAKASIADGTPIQPSDGGKATEKIRKSQYTAIKKKQKELKKAKAEQKRAEDYEAFDYSKAKSVIKGDKSKRENRGKKEKKLFNKNLEGDIKPARRMNYEKSGKSQTFKN